MGWNSWNHFGPFVSERLVLESADAHIERGVRMGVRDLWGGSDVGTSDEGYVASVAPHQALLLKLSRAG